MSKVRVAAFGVSLDGFGAGTGQCLDEPLGKRGPEIFQWFFPTLTFRAMDGHSDGETGPDDDFARRSFENVGAWILGRNMFGPVRGPWPDDLWKGWWGANPPFHTPVFVLSHHARESFTMEGGTTFHFVTSGMEDALRRAKQTAGRKDVRIGGGVATVRQFLQAGHIDSLHFAMSPAVLGCGEALFANIDLVALGFTVTEHKQTERAMHVVLEKQ